MPPALAETILWTAALIVLAAIVAAGWFLARIGRAFGNNRRNGALVAATAFTLLLHLGLLLAPLWWHRRQFGLGVGLSLPMTLLDLLGVLALVGRLGLPPSGGRRLLVLAVLLLFVAALVAIPLTLGLAAANA